VKECLDSMMGSLGGRKRMRATSCCDPYKSKLAEQWHPKITASTGAPGDPTSLHVAIFYPKYCCGNLVCGVLTIETISHCIVLDFHVFKIRNFAKPIDKTVCNNGLWYL